MAQNLGQGYFPLHFSLTYIVNYREHRLLRHQLKGKATNCPVLVSDFAPDLRQNVAFLSKSAKKPLALALLCARYFKREMKL